MSWDRLILLGLLALFGGVILAQYWTIGRLEEELEDYCETLDRSRVGCRERIERLEQAERWTPEG